MANMNEARSQTGLSIPNEVRRRWGRPVVCNLGEAAMRHDARPSTAQQEANSGGPCPSSVQSDRCCPPELEARPAQFGEPPFLFQPYGQR